LEMPLIWKSTAFEGMEQARLSVMVAETPSEVDMAALAKDIAAELGGVAAPTQDKPSEDCESLLQKVASYKLDHERLSSAAGRDDDEKVARKSSKKKKIGSVCSVKVVGGPGMVDKARAMHGQVGKHNVEGVAVVAAQGSVKTAGKVSLMELVIDAFGKATGHKATQRTIISSATPQQLTKFQEILQEELPGVRLTAMDKRLMANFAGRPFAMGAANSKVCVKQVAEWLEGKGSVHSALAKRPRTGNFNVAGKKDDWPSANARSEVARRESSGGPKKDPEPDADLPQGAPPKGEDPRGCCTACVVS